MNDRKQFEKWTYLLENVIILFLNLNHLLMTQISHYNQLIY